MEWGFGAPTQFAASGLSAYTIGTDYPSDWGFGDSSPNYTVSGTTLTFESPWAAWDSTTADTGYGSQFKPIVFIVIIEPFGFGLFEYTSAPASRLPDDGGVVVQLQNADTWPAETFFYATLRDENSVEWPKGGFCNSPHVGGGVKLTKAFFDKVIEFVLPPLPLGRYDVIIRWGVGKGNIHVDTDRIKILRRDRSRATYAMRKRMSDAFKSGIRRVDMEKLLLGGGEA